MVHVGSTPPADSDAAVAAAAASAAAAAADASADAAAAAHAAGPVAAAADAPADLGQLPHELLIAVFARQPSFQHAVRAAPACRAFRDAARAARPAFLPRIGPDGAVLEPASGRFTVQVAPGEAVAAAFARCPEGGSLLFLPGEHLADEEMPVIRRSLHVFGRGAATLRLSVRVGLSLSAAATTLDGLRLVGQEGINLVVGISGATAAPRLHGVEIDAGGAKYGIGAAYGAAPTI